jgi:hypothetical protein
MILYNKGEEQAKHLLGKHRAQAAQTPYIPALKARLYGDLR